MTRIKLIPFWVLSLLPALPVLRWYLLQPQQQELQPLQPFPSYAFCVSCAFYPFYASYPSFSSSFFHPLLDRSIRLHSGMCRRCHLRGRIVVHLLTSGHKGTKCQAFVSSYFQLGDSNGIAQIPKALSPSPPLPAYRASSGSPCI